MHDLEGPGSGHAQVDAVVHSLTGLDQLPVERHVAVYESAQAALRSALDDVTALDDARDAGGDSASAS